MKVKLDENIPIALAELLQNAGHDVATVPGEQLEGASDSAILKAATSERRVLMTFDIDFANARSHPPRTHAGIIVFRLRDQRWAALKDAVRRVLAAQILERLQDGLAIVDETRVRIRIAQKD